MLNGQSPSADSPIQGEAPFPAGQTRYHILRAGPGSPVRVVCLNSCVYGVRTHYVEGRTVPCTDQTRGYCDHCAESKPRWYGYMGGLIPQVGRLALAEMTYEAAKACPMLHQVGVDLRGKLLKVERIGESKRGRVVATFEEMRIAVKLPRPHDIPAALCAIWGVAPTVAGFQIARDQEGGE